VFLKSNEKALNIRLSEFDLNEESIDQAIEYL